MAQNALSGEPRSDVGKGVARKLRAGGRIPAVVYGKGKGGEAIAVDPAELARVLQKSGSGMNTLIDLSVGSRSATVLVKDLQRDPVRGRYLHADFYEVDLQKEVQVAVPLHFVGKAKGLEFGGIVEHPVRELEVACLPGAIPDAIEVDVTELMIGDSLHVREVAVPEGVRVVTDADLAVALVEQPAAEEEPVAEVAEGEEAAAPAEGEEAAPADGAKDKEAGDESPKS